MLHDNVAFQFSWWEQALNLAVCKHCPVPSGTCRWFLSQALGSFYMSVLISTLLNTAVPLCLWGIGSRTPHLPSLPTPKSADAHVSSKNGVVPKKKKKNVVQSTPLYLQVPRLWVSYIWRGCTVDTDILFLCSCLSSVTLPLRIFWESELHILNSGCLLSSTSLHQAWRGSQSSNLGKS